MRIIKKIVVIGCPAGFRQRPLWRFLGLSTTQLAARSLELMPTLMHLSLDKKRIIQFKTCEIGMIQKLFNVTGRIKDEGPMAAKENPFCAEEDRYLCAHCSFPVHFPDDSSKCLCHKCGSVNNKPAGDATKSWLPCVLPEEFEWVDPIGVIGPDVPIKVVDDKELVDYDRLVLLPMNARVIYIDPMNKQWSRMDWINRRCADPAITLREFRRHAEPVLSLK